MSDVLPVIESVQGFSVAGVHAGLKKDNRLDFALIVSDRPCSAAGVFTTNYVKAAPVLLDMERLAADPAHIRAVAVNTGCANACTGQRGLDNAIEMARLTAARLGVLETQVLVLSTGVIGTHLPMDAIERGADYAAAQLGTDQWEAAANAIMTTDTRPKMAFTEVTLSSGQTCRIAGISKGAGMIAPNMATMLAVIVTDAGLTPEQAHGALTMAAQVSLNRITVDGDMSTNDTALLLANGASGVVIESPDDLRTFQKALTTVSTKLAKDIVRDGEGATKFIAISVHGAPDDADARKIADAIATSPLVKTAFYGGDANWGRILAAAGRAGVPLDPSRLTLLIAPREDVADLSGDALTLVRGGVPTAYSEEHATAIFKGATIFILLTCGQGDGWATVWTCDLSHDYVSINGHYRS